MQVFCHLFLIFCLLKWNILEFGGDPWESTNSPACLFFPGLYLMGFFQAHLWTWLVILLFCSVFSSQDPEACHFMVTAGKAAPGLHIPDRFFLVSKYKIREGIFSCWLLGCWNQCTSEISWITLWHTILSPQQILGSPNTRFLPVIWRNSSCISYSITCW